MKTVLAVGLAASLMLAGAAEARGNHAGAHRGGGGHHSRGAGGGGGGGMGGSGLGMKSPDPMALGMGSKGGKTDAFSLGAAPTAAQKRAASAGRRGHRPARGSNLSGL